MGNLGEMSIATKRPGTSHQPGAQGECRRWRIGIRRACVRGDSPGIVVVGLEVLHSEKANSDSLPRRHSTSVVRGWFAWCRVSGSVSADFMAGGRANSASLMSGFGLLRCVAYRLRGLFAEPFPRPLGVASSLTSFAE
jgi:hypothetical protein